MRDRTKWMFVAAALAVTAGAQVTARAGNLDLPACQYYSVQLHAGERMTYSGTEEEYTLTVDDVTYSVQINPCDLHERCCFFTESEITAAAFDGDSWQNSFTPPHNAGGGVGLFGQSTSSGQHQKSYVNQVISKGAHLRLELTEGPAGEVPPSALCFDAISHSVYAEYIEKWKYERDTSFTEMFYPTWRQLIEPGMAASGEFGSPSGWATATDSKTSSDAIGLTSWAVPTSESRHYQSPQIVQQGGGVTLLSTFGVAQHGQYTDTMAMLKGRVLFGSTGAPVENFNFQISSN